MMEQPLVSVICLCYNHEKTVFDAIKSVLNQTYPNIEVIIVDDASEDQSIKIITELVLEYPFARVILNEKNLGNCKAFNLGLTCAKGSFIIDFATDDLMHPERIDLQVSHMLKLDQSYGVVFTDALYVDECNVPVRTHFKYLFDNGLIKYIPQGDVYQQLLSVYFVASPTMMVRREVFDQLNGYDENLSYEDFDFWIRSSRYFKYSFLVEPLTTIRRSSNSMSTGWYKKGDSQLYSTYLVCRKALDLNRDKDDKRALIKRVRYELRQSVFSENYYEAKLFFQLLKELGGVRLIEILIFSIHYFNLPLAGLRIRYHKFRFRY